MRWRVEVAQEEDRHPGRWRRRARQAPARSVGRRIRRSRSIDSAAASCVPAASVGPYGSAGGWTLTTPDAAPRMHLHESARRHRIGGSTIGMTGDAPVSEPTRYAHPSGVGDPGGVAHRLLERDDVRIRPTGWPRRRGRGRRRVPPSSMLKTITRTRTGSSGDHLPKSSDAAAIPESHRVSTGKIGVDASSDRQPTSPA